MFVLELVLVLRKAHFSSLAGSTARKEGEVSSRRRRCCRTTTPKSN